MRDCNVITSALDEVSPDNAVKCIYKEVVIVGNGPSAITLSYLLTGHWPYYNRIPHPDPMLSARLIECTQKSLLYQDLSFLSQGIEGRSKNPISLLIDAMTHPGADMGLEWPSLLTWKKTNKGLDHVVLGKGVPGGVWPGIAEHILTISPGRWMALPGMEFKEYHDKRAPAGAVARYYMNYIKQNDLTSYMTSHTTATMIQPITCKSRRRARWKVWVTDSNGGTISYECRYLVLATGATDKAGCLGVPGESLPYVNHDLKSFEEQLSDDKASATYMSPTIDFAENIFTKEVMYSYKISGGSLTSSDGEDKRRKELSVNEINSDIQRNSIGYVGDVENVFKDEDIRFVLETKNEKEINLSLEELELNRTDKTSKVRSSIDAKKDEKEGKDCNKKVLVVGAGLSAADAIITAWNKNYTVIHAFRSLLTTAQLPAVMYPEYHELYKLMQGFSSRKDYEPLPGYQITEFCKDNSVHLVDSTGNKKTLDVHSVAILIGSQPDLFFLPKTLKNLGIDPNKPVDCKVNPVQIDPFSYKCVRAPPGLYALGPLVGDNFVRFLQGGAVAIAGHIFKDNSLHKSSK